MKTSTSGLRFGLFAGVVLILAGPLPADGKPRPTVDSKDGQSCFEDPTTDKNCNALGQIFGAICYCCYDDGCWICGSMPTPGNECVWDPKYRALATPIGIGPMATEDAHQATQQALIAVLEKNKVVTKKALVDEVMTARKARVLRTLERGKLKESLAAQKAINRYFHASVVPRLKACWERVQGPGSIEIQYRYEDDGRGGWAFKTLRAGASDLPKGQAEVAVVCMQEAVSGTSFPKDKRGAAKSYLINWVWPTPLPADATQLVERMRGATGGEGAGCDGHGAPARCVACSGSPQSCAYVCVGSDTCEVQATTTNGFNSICSEGGQCASGGPFGVVGARVSPRDGVVSAF
jgi:hypothetical protein